MRYSRRLLSPYSFLNNCRKRITGMNYNTNQLGFNFNEGETIKYPVDLPIRKYQLDVVKDAVYNNALVCLPTGMGKTFIAAVLMWNYNRWFPNKKLIFMAPTKPLVQQQMQACWSIVGLAGDKTVDMTGSLPPKRREALWKSNNIFFLTPQILHNDISRGSCNPNDIILLVTDEAHHATGNYSYCQVIKSIHSVNTKFRILALTASPGSSVVGVQKIVDNLLIKTLHLYTNDHPEILPYIHGREQESIVVELDQQIIHMENQLLKILNPVFKRLIDQRAIYPCDPKKLSKYRMIMLRDQFRIRLKPKLPKEVQGFCESDFALAIKLAYSHELLVLYGFRNFCRSILDYLSMPDSGRIGKELQKYPDFIENVRSINNLLQSPLSSTDPSLLPCHPKLTKLCEILLGHFANCGNPAATRVIVFTQYRDSVIDIEERLKFHSPTISVVKFIGQAKSRGSGQNQKQQLDAVEKFKNGSFNVLVSTSVGEEGLDIGNVDLIVCFDASSSPLRMLQRIGRTGRHRTGRIVVLMTEGREEAMHKNAQDKAKSVTNSLLRQLNSLRYYQNNPRLLPLSGGLVVKEVFLKNEKDYEKKESDVSVNKQIKPPNHTIYSDPSDDFQECNFIKKSNPRHQRTESIILNSDEELFENAIFDIESIAIQSKNGVIVNNAAKINSSFQLLSSDSSSSSLEEIRISPCVVPSTKFSNLPNTSNSHPHDESSTTIKRPRKSRPKLSSSTTPTSPLTIYSSSDNMCIAPKKKKKIGSRKFLLSQAQVDSQDLSNISKDELDDTHLPSSDSLNDFIVNSPSVHDVSSSTRPKLFDTSLDMYQQSLFQTQAQALFDNKLISPFNKNIKKNRMLSLAEHLQKKYVENREDSSFISNSLCAESADQTTNTESVLIDSLSDSGESADKLFEEQLGHISLGSSDTCSSASDLERPTSLNGTSQASFLECIFVDSIACVSSSYSSIGKLVSLLRNKYHYSVIPVSNLNVMFIINYDTVIEIINSSDACNKTLLGKIHCNLTQKCVSDFYTCVLIIEKDSTEKKFDTLKYNKELTQMMISNIRILHSPSAEYTLKIIDDINRLHHSASINMECSQPDFNNTTAKPLQFKSDCLTEKNLKACETMSRLFEISFVKTLSLISSMGGVGKILSVKAPSDIMAQCEFVSVQESRRIIMSSTSQKHKTFVADPIKDKTTKDLPGIGDVYSQRLESSGFTKAYHVLGQFLVLDKNMELFVDWMTDVCELKSTKCAVQCYNALYEWTEQFI